MGKNIESYKMVKIKKGEVGYFKGVDTFRFEPKEKCKNEKI